MSSLNYEEQAIIKMYSFETKAELIEQLNKSLEEITDNDMKQVVENIIHKINEIPLEELKKAINIFE